jgi:glutamyl-tRNA reductase
MFRNYKAIGISYKSCPIEIREILSLDEGQAKQLITLIKETTSATELLVLSTCNRTELYYACNEDISIDLIKCLGVVKGLLNIADYQSYFTFWNDNQEVVKHLFGVAMGLEAQVVGDIQISNQVKKAYQWSADEEVAGPFLHRLMHTIFFTNKRVIQETAFRDGAASVSYAATELVGELARNFTEPKILVLGLGEIGSDVCKNLKESDFTNIKITNRTLVRAEELAEECGFEVIPFDQAAEAIKEADIVLSSIGRSTPFITRAFVESMNITYKIFIDLAVPRSVEALVDEVPGALVYNVDNIQNKASKALQKRIDAIPAVEQIISDAIEEFNDWSKELIVSPTINKLKNALEDIRKEELVRYLKNANDQETKMLQDASKSMMQKIMKLPVLQLKAACKRGEAETLIDVLNDLFNLDQQPTDKK